MLKTSASTRRIGIVGNPHDPMGQLLEDQPHRADDVFFPLVDPADADNSLDEIVVLSQADALGHFPALLASSTPITIILRRHSIGQNSPDWQQSYKLLLAGLNEAQPPHIALCALTDEAVHSFVKVADHNISQLPPLVPTRQVETTFPIDRSASETTFFLVNSDGSREARRAEHAAFNWVKLRRLANLRAVDRDDQDLCDLVELANETRTSSTQSPTSKPLKMLAVVPNGVGLGHITRMMALAKALQANGETEVIFWCFSRAAEILQAAGYQIILRQTAAHLGAHPPDWRALETQEFALAIQTLKPDLVSYDGAMIDPFVFNALKMPGCGRTAFLWVRRGMLRPDSDPLFMENEQFADLILEPGDLAVEVDKGPTRTRQADKRGFSQHFTSAPVSLAITLPSYTRREAKAQMNLGWGKHCIVSLGGAFGDWDRLEALLIKHAHANGVKLIWAQSPLAAPPRSSELLVRRLFPLSRYLPGIDGVVTATGYNSFHELMLTYDKPVLFAPTNHVRMDDQASRARYAAAQGWASVAFSDRPEDMDQQIATFMKQVKSGTSVSNRPKQSLDQRDFYKRIQSVASRYHASTLVGAAE